jgi:hypothetical protein
VFEGTFAVGYKMLSMKLYFDLKKTGIFHLTGGGRLCTLNSLSSNGVKFEKSEVKAWVFGQIIGFYDVQFFWRPRPAPIKISTTTATYKVEALWKTKVFFTCVYLWNPSKPLTQLK